MAISNAFPYQIVAEITTDIGNVTAATTRLHSVTVTGAIPAMLFVATPGAALPTGLAFGAPYCTAANTVVIPVINPTASDQDPDSQAVKIVAL